MELPIKLYPFLWPMACPFCDGDVDHPKLVSHPVLRYEFTCSPCNLTMHENVEGNGDQNAQDYARFRLAGRWSIRPVVPKKKPVPSHVYFNEATERFIHETSGQDMGDEFLMKWVIRVDEFPKRQEDTRGF